ncbi:MAG: hypothetical protein WC629_00440 [Candidatus Paceibacterota bacterium]|jgi:hypothetical protein
MKSENKNVNDERENSLLCLFRKLYDQQFPQTRSCFKLISIEERIEDLKEENRTHNKWMIRIGYLLLAISAFNLQFADHIKEWGDSPYHLVVMWVTIGCALWVLISAFTKFALHFSPIITKYEVELCGGGFYFYKDVEKLFTNLISKITLYDIKTPNELAEQLENDLRFLVFLIKKGETYPDKNKRNHFLKKIEDDLLKNLIELICTLRMMKVEEADNTTSTIHHGNLFDKRAAWLRKKLFDEVAT